AISRVVELGIRLYVRRNSTISRKARSRRSLEVTFLGCFGASRSSSPESSRRWRASSTADVEPAALFVLFFGALIRLLLPPRHASRLLFAVFVSEGSPALLRIASPLDLRNDGRDYVH